MSEQAEKTEVVIPAVETFPDASERKRIDRVAEEVAEKASTTEKKYDSDHAIFSK